MYMGVGAVPAGQTMAWPLFGRQKENQLQVVHAYVDNKFYNESTSLCRFQDHGNSFNSYFATFSAISSINVAQNVVTTLYSYVSHDHN